MVAAVPDAAEGLDRALVGIGEGVQIPLGGHDRRVPEAFPDYLEVGSAGQQP